MKTYVFLVSRLDASARVFRACVVASLMFLVLSVSACCGSGHSKGDPNLDRAEELILRGSWDELRIHTGCYVVAGPQEVLDYIKHDTVNGKRRLSALLKSSQSATRYFAVLALSQVGDAESRDILWRWASKHYKDDQGLAVIAATRLTLLRDFRLVALLSRVDASNPVVFLHVLGMARNMHLPGCDNDSWIGGVEQNRQYVERVCRVFESLRLEHPWLFVGMDPAPSGPAEEEGEKDVKRRMLDGGQPAEHAK